MAQKIDISDYYRIVEVQDRYVHDEVTGFWSDKVVERVGPEFLRIWKRAAESFGGREYITLTDWSACPVLTERAKEFLVKAMDILKATNGQKVVEVVPKRTTRLSLRSAALQSGEDDFRIIVESLSEGKKIVEELVSNLG